MEKKFEYCVKKPYDSTGDHYEAHHTKKHHDAAMPRWSFCGDGYFPESPVRVIVRQIRTIPPDYDPHIDLHTHDRDELYIFVSEEEDGFEAEVQLGDEIYQVKSPVTILLPKDVPHRYAAKKGHGFCLRSRRSPARSTTMSTRFLTKDEQRERSRHSRTSSSQEYSSMLAELMQKNQPHT